MNNNRLRLGVNNARLVSLGGGRSDDGAGDEADDTSDSFIGLSGLGGGSGGASDGDQGKSCGGDGFLGSEGHWSVPLILNPAGWGWERLGGRVSMIGDCLLFPKRTVLGVTKRLF